MVTSLLPKANILIHNVKRKKKCIADVSLWDPLAVAYIYDPPGLLAYLHVHTHTQTRKLKVAHKHLYTPIQHIHARTTWFSGG